MTRSWYFFGIPRKAGARRAKKSAADAADAPIPGAKAQPARVAPTPAARGERTAGKEPQRAPFEERGYRRSGAAREAAEPSPDHGPDDDRAELEGEGPLAMARQRERQRIKSIIQSSAGRALTGMAIDLATKTTSPSCEAIALLASQLAFQRGIGPNARDDSWRRAFAGSHATDDRVI